MRSKNGLLKAVSTAYTESPSFHIGAVTDIIKIIEKHFEEESGGSSLKIIPVRCVCGEELSVIVSGKNNADGKNICSCGRHITIHFRRDRK